MEQQHLQLASTYADALIERLLDLYLQRTPLPDAEQKPLTVERFFRIYRCVLAEGYGEA